MNERPLDGALARAIDVALGAAPLERSPFFRPTQWRFATIPYDGENLAEHFPEQLQDRLSSPAAEAAAARMPAEQWSGCLRNALAHGGIVYLDDAGRQSFGERVTQLAFVSASYPRGEGRQAPDQLRALRISEEGFNIFLNNWAQWLGQTGLSLRLAA
jgi:hypothetical protein